MRLWLTGWAGGPQGRKLFGFLNLPSSVIIVYLPNSKENYNILYLLCKICYTNICFFNILSFIFLLKDNNLCTTFIIKLIYMQYI